MFIILCGVLALGNVSVDEDDDGSAVINNRDTELVSVSKQGHA